MRVHDVGPSQMGPYAFEVGSWLGRRQATRVVEGVEGVRILRRPGFLLRFREEVFCEFVLKEQLFNIWEPYGNHSRYWIGPSGGKRASQLMLVRQAFIDYNATGIRTLANWLHRRKGIS